MATLKLSVTLYEYCKIKKFLDKKMMRIYELVDKKDSKHIYVETQYLWCNNIYCRALMVMTNIDGEDVNIEFIGHPDVLRMIAKKYGEKGW